MTIDFGDNKSVGVPGVGPVVSNEFAAVSVRFDVEGNAPRLRLEDLRGGRVRYLDALELETIIWLPEERVTAMLDPSHSRWRGEATEHDKPNVTLDG
jgi:hypothetical protein